MATAADDSVGAADSGRHVLYTVVDGIATVTLNRPEHLNAFTDQMESALLECFDRSDDDQAVRAVILTGAGRAFCAGMDLSETPDPRDAFVEWRRRGVDDGGSSPQLADGLPVRRDGGGRVALRIFASRKPVIAAINGHAAGVGVTMTLPADIRIGSATAKFTLPFTRRGFVPESCSSWFLPRIVPQQRAFEWMLTGRTFGAGEALDGGLLRSVHAPEDVYDVALGLAHEIADNTSAVSVALTRQMLWQMMTAPHPMDAHRMETLALNVRGVSADAREGIGSFLEKRQPQFADGVTADTVDALTQWREAPWQQDQSGQ